MNVASCREGILVGQDGANEVCPVSISIQLQILIETETYQCS